MCLRCSWLKSWNPTVNTNVCMLPQSQAYLARMSWTPLLSIVMIHRSDRIPGVLPHTTISKLAIVLSNYTYSSKYA